MLLYVEVTVQQVVYIHDGSTGGGRFEIVARRRLDVLLRAHTEIIRQSYGSYTEIIRELYVILYMYF